MCKVIIIVARYGAQIFRYAYRGISDTAYRVDTRIVLKKNRGHKTLIKPLNPFLNPMYYVTGRIQPPGALQSAPELYKRCRLFVMPNATTLEELIAPELEFLDDEDFEAAMEESDFEGALEGEEVEGAVDSDDEESS